MLVSQVGDYRFYEPRGYSVSVLRFVGNALAIREHPVLGSILICDFDRGFREPEMVKRRPVVVISPKIARRPGLCTVVCLSTKDPDPVMDYHRQIIVEPLLPEPWNSRQMWIKGDMVYSVGFHRLDFIRRGKDQIGKRMYDYRVLNNSQIREVRSCLLRSLAMSQLTNYLP